MRESWLHLSNTVSGGACKSGNACYRLMPVSCVAFAIPFHAKILRIHVYDDGAIPVRTQQFAARFPVSSDHFLVGMAVTVAVAYSKDRVTRMGRIYEIIYRRSLAAMVRHDQQSSGKFFPVLFQ